jgi:hypothetical protein
MKIDLLLHKQQGREEDEDDEPVLVVAGVGVLVLLFVSAVACALVTTHNLHSKKNSNSRANFSINGCQQL